MIPIHHLTDDDLVAVGNDMSLDMSYYAAGWDFANRSAAERAAEIECLRRAIIIDREMARRGLRTTVTTLCPLGAPHQEEQAA